MRINPNITAQVLREAADEITSYETINDFMDNGPGWAADTMVIVHLVADHLRERADRVIWEAGNRP